MEWYTAVLAAAGVGFLGWLGSVFNRLTRARHEAENARASIDIYLQQRHDLIPNLVRTVRAAGTHEQETLEKVSRARNLAMRAESGSSEAFERENQLTGSLRTLLSAVDEAYPELKSDSSFRFLMKQLSEKEEQIALARQRYNDSVMIVRNLVDQVPSRFVASATGQTEVPPYFEAVEPATETIDISSVEGEA